MSALLELIRNAAADSSLQFRTCAYGPGEQGELLRDVVALANASVVGRRFLILGVDDQPDGTRRFPGISARAWNSLGKSLPAFLSKAVEPRLRVTLHATEIDGALIGAVCLEGCEDPPYLLARSIGPTMSAGAGWVRHGTRQGRILRKHLQRIFEARFRREEAGDISVGFPGKLPREELVLPIMPLDAVPSEQAARKITRMIDARRVSKEVLGRSDSHIARLVHAQVAGGTVPYEERGTKTMRVLLRKAPLEHAAADEHYQYEVRAHRINLVLNNLGDVAHKELVLTVKIPRLEGVSVPHRIHPAPGEPAPRHCFYPMVDVGPRTITVQVAGLTIPRRDRVDAFAEPLRLCLRQAALNQTIRIAYTLQGPTLGKPIRGRLKIFVID